MASLKKNFSISKLYSDLEKYQANLTNIKDSRLKKQASASSFYQRPSSTHKTYESRQSYTHQNITRFQKPRQELGSRSKHPRPTYQKSRYEEKNSFVFDDQKEKHQYRDFTGFVSQKSSVLRENYLQNSQAGKENKQSKLSFNKSDELYFLNECNRLYKLNEKSSSKALTTEEQADSVKILLNEINKRDKIFQSLSKKLGADNIEQKLDTFFSEYDRMTKIIGEFKKMSKLNIDNDEQLYEFLLGDGQQEEQKIVAKKQKSKREENEKEWKE